MSVRSGAAPASENSGVGLASKASLAGCQPTNPIVYTHTPSCPAISKGLAPRVTLWYTGGSTAPGRSAQGPA